MLTRWSPANDLVRVADSLFREIDRANEFARSGSGERLAHLPLDVYTTDNDIVVIAAVPGVNPEAIDIKVDNDVLTIEGAFPAQLENVDYIFSERFHGRFVRSLKLNIPVDADAIEATVENGILTVVLPKSEAVRPRQIEVKARS